MSSNLQDVLSHIDNTIEASAARLCELLTIPSISTDPAFAPECRKAAGYMADTLNGIGFEAAVRETTGHPMVVGHWTGQADGVTTALFYGHYDVQPPDPVELWDADPFDPQIKEGANGPMIVARGASDDKGQLMTMVEACRAWVETTGGLPIPLSILLEGEEESGSTSLAPFLDQHAGELSKDVALVCDTGMWDAETPAITTMLRGMVYEEVAVTGPNRDLHSGIYGGAARNPIRVLSRILAGLHDPTGHVKIPGFYDGVEELDAERRDQWTALGFDAVNFLGGVGLGVPAGESDRSVLEQVWARPTADVNGVIGGYTGEGAKTVIPSIASAKVSFRLVAGQDPDAISTAFREFVEHRLPADCSATFQNHGNAPALRISTENEHLGLARAALQDEFGRDAAMIGSGGSIPIVGNFKEQLGMDSLLVGFALDDDNIHSPNEKYNLASYHRGIRSWARILDRLARRAS
ncbi:MAG: M20/M25/M40 family metallo-hydrolase [Pseudomonadota bacterium]